MTVHVAHLGMLPAAGSVVDHSRGFALKDRRSSLHSQASTLLSKLAFYLLNVALAELRSRRLTRNNGERLATPARAKVAQIWTFFSANVGRAHHQTWTVPFKQAEKKSSRSKPCYAKEVPQKSTESNASCMIKRPGCPEPHARAVIIQSVN